MIDFDPAKTHPRDLYRIMVSAIVPRPIAFIATENAKGQGNLAPFSFFNGVSSKPPCLAFSCTQKSDGNQKDTLINIEETKEFVVNIVGEPIAAAMHKCGEAFPYGVDEMNEVGLTPLPSVKVKPPGIAESAVQIECKLHQTVKIGAGMGSATLVIGEIVYIRVREGFIKNNEIDIDALRPVARLGDRGYAKLGEIFKL